MLKVTVAPGKEVKVHKHPVINAAVLLSGEITVTSEKGDEIKLEAGDSIIELVDTWHHGINTGNVPTVILAFYAGLKDHPISIKK